MGSSDDDRSTQVIEGLLDAGVIELDEAEDEFRMTDGFNDRIDECRAIVADLDHDSLRDELIDATSDPDEAEALLAASETSEDIVADYLALSRTDGNQLSHAERLRAMTVFDALRRSPPPADGAPDPFVPVHGDRLPFLVQLYPRVIVYIWLHDCDPCDLMKESFEELLEEPPDEIAFFAVYGPDSSDLLQDRYDVSAGPATLFFLNGEVDLRLYGPQYERLLENEIEKLRGLG